MEGEIKEENREKKLGRARKRENREKTEEREEEN